MAEHRRPNSSRSAPGEPRLPLELPPPQNSVGRRRRLKAIDGTLRYFTVIDEIVRQQNIPERQSGKLIYLQKLRFEDDGSEQYRFCYYMLGVKPKTGGRWVFGQYALLIPSNDLRHLLAEARRRGWSPF